MYVSFICIGHLSSPYSVFLRSACWQAIRCRAKSLPNDARRRGLLLVLQRSLCFVHAENFAVLHQKASFNGDRRDDAGVTVVNDICDRIDDRGHAWVGHIKNCDVRLLAGRERAKVV